jgi:hypothetical protein
LQHPWRRDDDSGGPELKEDAISAALNHADDARVITAGILRQTPEKIAETRSGKCPLNRSRFHTANNCLFASRARYFTSKTLNACHGLSKKATVNEHK